MEKVILRELRYEDSDKYFKWINDRELVLHNSSYKPVSQHEHNKWFDSVSMSKDILIFSILNNSDLIGSCSLRNIDEKNKTAELQIRIGEKNFQNKGIGKLCVKNLLRFGFNDLNINRIYLNVFSTNLRAINVYKKCGFQEEGVLRESIYLNGNFIDVILMSVLKNEYVDNQNQL